MRARLTRFGVLRFDAATRDAMRVVIIGAESAATQAFYFSVVMTFGARVASLITFELAPVPVALGGQVFVLSGVAVQSGTASQPRCILASLIRTEPRSARYASRLDFRTRTEDPLPEQRQPIR